MIEVYLARHGQTEENISRIFQGHLPGRLTEEGKRQAVELGEKLRDIELDAIVSSDLQRVIDTVRLAVGDRLAMAGRPLPWKQTALLREIDWGSWTGLPIQSVDLEKQPEDVETREMLYERAGRCRDYLMENYQGMRVLVVAHGLINRSLQAQIQGIPITELTSIPHMQNAEVRRLIIPD